MTDQAQGQQFDIAVMAVLAAPVLLFVWVYFAYALIVWRRREGDEEDGPPIHGNTKVQATWITATAVIVLGLFVFGTAS
jgi:cytochrome c oxidase subunit 2